MKGCAVKMGFDLDEFMGQQEKKVDFDLDKFMSPLRGANDDDNIIKATGYGFMSATGNMIHTAQDAGTRMAKPSYKSDEEWQASQPGLVKKISQFGRELEEDYKRDYSAWSPNRIAHGVGGVAPYAAGLGAATVAAGKSGNYQMIGQAANQAVRNIGVFGKYAPQVAKAAEILAPAATVDVIRTVPEAGLEWQGAYDGYIDDAKRDSTYVQGETEKKAEEISNAVFRDNIALLGGTNLLETIALTTKLPLSKVKSAMVKIMGGASMNAGEEMAQQIFPKAEAGNPYSLTDDDVLEAGVIGAITGAGMQGGGMVADHILGDDGSPPEASGISKDQFFGKVAAQESGGDYSAQNGRTGAFGKYQIMPDNWPSWSKEAGLLDGAEMTPENQEVVAKYKLGDYFDKYGPEGALVAWYSGEGNAQRWIEGKPTAVGEGGEYSWDARQGKGDEPSVREYVAQALGRESVNIGDRSGITSVKDNQVVTNLNTQLAEQEKDFFDSLINEKIESLGNTGDLSNIDDYNFLTQNKHDKEAIAKQYPDIAEKMEQYQQEQAPADETQAPKIKDIPNQNSNIQSIIEKGNIELDSPHLAEMSKADPMPKGFTASRDFAGSADVQQIMTDEQGMPVVPQVKQVGAVRSIGEGLPQQEAVPSPVQAQLMPQEETPKPAHYGAAVRDLAARNNVKIGPNTLSGLRANNSLAIDRAVRSLKQAGVSLDEIAQYDPKVYAKELLNVAKDNGVKLKYGDLSAEIEQNTPNATKVLDTILTSKGFDVEQIKFSFEDRHKRDRERMKGQQKAIENSIPERYRGEASGITEGMAEHETRSVQDDVNKKLLQGMTLEQIENGYKVLYNRVKANKSDGMIAEDKKRYLSFLQGAMNYVSDQRRNGQILRNEGQNGHGINSGREGKILQDTNRSGNDGSGLRGADSQINQNEHPNEGAFSMPEKDKIKYSMESSHERDRQRMKEQQKAVDNYMPDRYRGEASGVTEGLAEREVVSIENYIQNELGKGKSIEDVERQLRVSYNRIKSNKSDGMNADKKLDFMKFLQGAMSHARDKGRALSGIHGDTERYVERGDKRRHGESVQDDDRSGNDGSGLRGADSQINQNEHPNEGAFSMPEKPKFSAEPNLVESYSFKKWFGNSMVVDDKGKPLVVYHGTSNPKRIDVFNSEKGKKYKGYESKKNLYFFSEDPDFSAIYANTRGYTVDDYDSGEFVTAVPDIGKMQTQKKSRYAPKQVDENDKSLGRSGGSVYPVYLKIKKLFDEMTDSEAESYTQYLVGKGYSKDDAEELAQEVCDGKAYMYRENDDFVGWLDENGYDGFTVMDGYASPLNYVVFNPNQIKSATANIGTFDANNPDIRYSFTDEHANTHDIASLKKALTESDVAFVLDMVRKEYGNKVHKIENEQLTETEQQHVGTGEEMGCRVVYYNAPSYMHGFHVGNTTFMNRNSSRPGSQTFWHETFHWIRNNNDKLYDDLVSFIQEHAPFSKKQIADYRKTIFRGELRNEDGSYVMTEGDIIEEMLADKMADVAGRLGLSKLLAKRNPNLYERFVEWINDMIQRVKRFAVNPQDARQAQLMKQMFYKMSTAMQTHDGKQIFKLNRNGKLELVKNGNEVGVRTGEQNIGDVVVAYSGEQNREQTVQFTGDELGKWDDIKDLREKAETFYRDNLQGKKVHNPIIGDVLLSGSGRRKALSNSANPNKLIVISKLDELISTAKNITEDINHKPDKRNVKKYYYLDHIINIGGKQDNIRISVFKDNNGNIYYNHILGEDYHKKDVPVSLSEDNKLSSSSAYSTSVNNSIPQNKNNMQDSKKDDIMYSSSNTRDGKLFLARTGEEISNSAGRIGDAAVAYSANKGRQNNVSLKKEIEYFSRQLDQWKAGQLNPRDMITVGSTPEVLCNLGAKQLPIVISQKVVAKVVKPQGEDGGKHGLSFELLKKLPEQIHDPVMVFESKTVPGNKVVLTELIDQENRPVIVAVHLAQPDGRRYEANHIASVYGRNNGNKFIMDQITEQRLLYPTPHNKKSLAWIRSRGLQLPSDGSSTTGSFTNNSIPQNKNSMQGPKKDDILYSFSNDNRGSSLFGKIKNVFSSGRVSHPISRPYILRSLEELGKVKIAFGKLSGDKEVVFKEVENVIRAKKAYEWETLLPKVGQAIGKQLQIDTPESMQNYIADWFLTGAVNNTSKEASAFAAAMKKNPAFAEKMMEVQELFAEWNGMEATKRAQAMISFDKPGKDTRSLLTKAVHTFHDQFIEELGPVKRMVQDIEKRTGKVLSAAGDPYVAVRLLRGHFGKSMAMIEGSEMAIKALRNVFPGINFDGFKTINMILRDADALHDKARMREFITYATAKHIKDIHEFNRSEAQNISDTVRDEYARKAKDGVLTEEEYMKMEEVIQKKQEEAFIETAFTEMDCDEIIQNAPAKFIQSQKDLVHYSDTLTAILADSGVISRKRYHEMRNQWKNYVPLFRMFGENEDVNFGDSMKRMVGSRRDLINPLEGIIKNTYAFVKAAEKNKAKAKLGMVARMSNIGEYIEPVDNGSPNDKTTISYFVDGQRKYLKTDPDIVKAVNSMGIESSNWFLKAFRFPTQLARATVTILNPEFAIRNLFRDVGDAVIYSKYGFTPADFVRGFMHAMKKDELYYEFIASGAGQASALSMDRNYTQSTIDKMTKTWKQEALSGKSILNALQAFGEYSEYGTRIGAYEKARKAEQAKAEAEGKREDIAGITEAALESRDLMDFARGGAASRSWNQVSMFANVSIQGWNKFFRTFDFSDPKQSKHAKSAALRLFFTAALPALALWAINHDDDRYKEIPDWQKEKHWIVFLGDKIFRIPKGQDVGIQLFSNWIEKGLSAVYDKDPVTMKKLMSPIIDMLPSLMPTAVLPVMEAAANHSYFTGRTIVPRYQENLPEKLQYGTDTTSLAKFVGEQTGLSPRKVEHVLFGYTGGLGKAVPNTYDYLADKKQLNTSIEELPFTRGIMIAPYKNSKTIGDYYEAADRQMKLYNELKTTGKRSDDFDVQLYGRIKAATPAMQRLSKFERLLADNKIMPVREKKAKQEELQQRRIAIAKKVMGR